MRPWVAVVCGVGLVVAALIAEAPASLADWRVGAMTGDRLHVANASGTLWDGSGDLVASGSSLRRHVAWRLERWPLLRGELRGTLATGADADHVGSFVVGPDKVDLERFELAMPMESLLRAAGAPALVASAGGDLGIHIDRFARDADALDVALAVQWRNASLPGLGPFARVMLGDVHAELSGRGREVSGPVANTGGEVEIDGTVTANATGTPRVDATIRPRAGIDRARASALALALSALGPADAEGRVRVAWPR
jgi:hypothetical protein